MQTVPPFRLLLKALMACVVVDLFFGLWHPSPSGWSVYNRLVPGRTRFPFGSPDTSLGNGYNVTMTDDFDSMFASHVISGKLKSAEEYRVIVLGDSSIWGLSLYPDETVVEQINKLNLTTCRGRAVQAYNLAMPLSLAFRDALLLQQSKVYQPDLYIWFVTLNSFLDRAGEAAFIQDQPDLSLALIEKYHLPIDVSGISPTSFTDKTLLGERRLIKKATLNQLNGLLWSATGIDFVLEAGQNAPVGLAADIYLPDFRTITDTEGLQHAMLFQYLAVGRTEAGNVPVLVVNESINRISGRNSDIRYNRTYPRWAYDEYRLALAGWMTPNRMGYLDLWDLLPEQDFLPSSSLHALPRGEQALAGRLAPAILEAACP